MDPMDPTPPASPNPEPTQEQHHAGQRRIKRRLMLGLTALYALSLGAAAVLVIRGRPQAPVAKEGGKGKSSLLASLTENKEMVGVVSIHGPIYSSESGKPWEKGAEQWARKIRAMSEAKGVKAIVLDINSPGGSIGAVQELHSQIQRVRTEKKIPVVALFGDVAASGGYYIAAACDKIVAHPGSLTGSIGVIFSITNLEGLFSKIGYKANPVKSGKHKDIGSPSRPMTEEERKILQNLVDDAYGQFVQAIAVGRQMDPAAVRVLADGRIYSGTQALESKLVDKLGDSTDAIELGAQLGGIQGKPKIKRDTERLSDFFDLLETRFQGVLGVSAAPAILEQFKRGPGLEYRWAGF